jgi:hypothetical protein
MAGAYPVEKRKMGIKKKQEVEKNENFLPVFFVKISLAKVQKRRWKYETLVSKS